MSTNIVELNYTEIDQVDGGRLPVLLIGGYALYVGVKEFAGVVSDVYGAAKAAGEWVATH